MEAAVSGSRSRSMAHQQLCPQLIFANATANDVCGRGAGPSGPLSGSRRRRSVVVKALRGRQAWSYLGCLHIVRVQASLAIVSSPRPRSGQSAVRHRIVESGGHAAAEAAPCMRPDAPCPGFVAYAGFGPDRSYALTLARVVHDSNAKRACNVPLTTSKLSLVM